MTSPKPHPDARLTLREAYDRHYFKDRLSAQTLELIETHLRRWERLTPNPHVGDITDETAAAFRQAAIDSGLSPASINTNWTMIRAVLRRLGPRETRNPWGLGIIPVVPAMRIVPQPRRKPRRVSLEDLSRFYVACKHAQFPRIGVPAAEWWRALLVFAYTSGLRKHDLLTLPRADVDLEHGEFSFVAHKTEKAERFPLHPAAVEHLRRIWLPERERLFGGLYFRGGRLYKQLALIQRTAGIEPFGLHDLRRTGASEVDRVDRGLGKIFLQHAPRGVTEVSYLNADEELREAILKMRLPVGFGCGPAMADRAADAARKQQVKLHAGDFAVPAPPHPREWRFEPGRFWFRGHWFRLERRRLVVLRLLAESERPVGVRTIIEGAFGAETAIDSEQLRNRAVGIISAIRKRLRRCFGLEHGFDPVPCVEFGNGGVWTIHLPPNLVPAPSPPGGGERLADRIRRARVRARMTQQDLAARIGTTKPTLQRWECGESEIPPAWRQRMEEALAEWIPDAGPVPADGRPILPAALRHARHNAGLTQNELGRRLGVNGELVNRWEKGRTPIPADWQRRLGELLGAYLDATAANLSPQQIREGRERRGWTKRYLAELLQVQPKSVRNWESGRQSPQLYYATTLRVILGPVDASSVRAS